MLDGSRLTTHVWGDIASRYGKVVTGSLLDNHAPVAVSQAVTDSLLLASIDMVTTRFGTPARAISMPSSVKSPMRSLLHDNRFSPSKICGDTNRQ